MRWDDIEIVNVIDELQGSRGTRRTVGRWLSTPSTYARMPPSQVRPRSNLRGICTVAAMGITGTRV